MSSIIIYTCELFKVSGGLSNFKLIFEILIKLRYRVYFCPLLEDIPSLNFTSPFNNIPIKNITHQEFIDYFIYPGYEIHCYTIPIENIVSPEILLKKDNVVIYTEDVIGNPTNQNYVVRWLHFFPIPNAVKHYDFKNDLICFYSDYIYNFYKYVCEACNCDDYLTSKITIPNICRIFKFEPEVYSFFQKYLRPPNLDMNKNTKCFTTRKLFPPYTFTKFTKSVNKKYAKEILTIHNSKIKKLQNKLIKINTNKSELMNQINLLKNNKPDVFSFSVVKEYLENKYSSLGFEEIEHKTETREFIEYFCKKDYFLSFDPFTFMSIIASLCGCISVVKKIGIIDYHTYINGDPFVKYGIAYGDEGIEHAINTKHLLLPHITEMYNQNTDNVINIINKIENKFNIKIQKL